MNALRRFLLIVHALLLLGAVGGLISLAGALSVAELAAALPHTGGWYVYLREGWGRLAGFLFGWSELVLIRASANGAINSRARGVGTRLAPARTTAFTCWTSTAASARWATVWSLWITVG